MCELCQGLLQKFGTFHQSLFVVASGQNTDPGCDGFERFAKQYVAAGAAQPLVAQHLRPVHMCSMCVVR